MSNTVTHNPNLYQWKRFAKKNPVAKPVPKTETDIEAWMRKVEEATDKAVSATFSDRSRKHRPRASANQYVDEDIAGTIDRLRDDETAHEEAQELVMNWMNEKLRYNFLEDEEDPNSGHPTSFERTAPGSQSVENAIYEKWYEDSETFIQNYLNSGDGSMSQPQRQKKQQPEDDFLGSVNIYEADENTVVQALMKKMMDKPVIKKKTMKKMKIDDTSPEIKQGKTKDPRVTMEMRQKEVKEARLRRRKEEEKRRQDEIIKREAKFRAQQVLKKEEDRKKLRVKQEEEAIQLEMTKLRKGMLEQRKRDEIANKAREKAIEEALIEEEQEQARRRMKMEKAEIEKQKNKIKNEIFRLEEKEKKVAEVLRRRDTENRKLLRCCLSAWCKMAMSQRVKLGKAKAMSDWKCMQHAWMAWKSYTQNQRLDLETRLHQDHVREVKLKEKRANDCARRRILRKCFFSWKTWTKAEQERKEILRQQGNTKAKMRALLDAIASGNIKNEQPATLQSIDSNDSADVAPFFEVQKPSHVAKAQGKDQKRTNQPATPKHAWQVTKRDVRNLQPEQMRHLKSSSPRSDTCVPSKPGPVYDPYENRHKFQKEVIDQQRMMLQEQKRMIEEMQEHQRMFALQSEIAVLQQNQKTISGRKVQVVENPQTTPTRTAVTTPRTGSVASRPASARSAGSDDSRLKMHPIVSKMEERAAERMKRRRDLEEIKRKKGEERVRVLQEEEERKQREEQEQKEREAEARREAKRQQKKLEAEKKAEQERMRELCKMADNHYRKSLLKHYGFRPWRKIIYLLEKKYEVASYNYESKLIRKTFCEWKLEVTKAIQERDRKADALYRTILLRRGLFSWMNYGRRMDILQQKATLHRNKVLLKHYIKSWVDYTTEEKLNDWRKEAQADAHNQMRLMRRVFNIIRDYRALILRNEERKKRLADMRQKVARLIPDFRPTRDSFASDRADDEDDT